MRRKPLRIEQREFPSTQMFDQRNQCDLRCISHAMKHRSAKNGAPDHDAVKSASELATGRVRPTGRLAAGPRFDRIGITTLMQTHITHADLAIDTGTLTR